MAPLSLAEAAADAAAATGPLYRRKGLRFGSDVPEDLPPVLGDRDRIIQVLVNLISNAVKFTPSGAIQLAAELDNDRALVRVEDTGVGIALEHQERIFEKFRQAGDTLTAKPQGTGLGLAICREIVEHYGGRIWAEAKPRQGSTFIFQLPTVPGERPQACPILAGEAMQEADRPLILVVDDDPGVCSFLLQFLEGEGYRVAAVTDGEAALDAARRLAPDLITMDLLMPSMDGRAVMNVLRGDPVLKHVPILVISAIPEGDPGWGDAALPKPIDEDRLLEAVHALLTRRYSKRLVTVLLRIFPDQREAFFALSGGEITRLSEEQFIQTATCGFAGTLVVPAWAARREDIRQALDRPGLHVLVLPENGNPGAA